MRYVLQVAVVLIAAMSATTIAAAQTASTPLNSADGQPLPDCDAARLFGSEDDGVLFVIYGSDERATIELTQLAKTTVERGARLVIEPGDQEIEKSAMPPRFQRGDAKALAFTAVPDDIAALSRAEAVTLRRGSEMLVRLPGTAIAEQVEVIKTCYRAKLIEWQVDVEARDRLSRLATPIPGKEGFSFKDYPDEAVRRGIKGTVTTRYTVDANGRVTDCNVVESSGSPILDQAPCPALKRSGRFEPALDANGNPTVSEGVRKTTFNILQ